MGAPVLGAFRGVCVDSADPRRLGRIRVLVPQVLGARVSGWAFPAWSMADLTVWPEDRLPQPGQGVWLMFEHQDRMVWLAAFGPPLLSDQRYDEIYDDEGRPVAYETSLSWNLPVLPSDVSVPVTGTLTSPSGTPYPDPVVVVEKSQDNNDPWTVIDAVAVEADGSWSTEYARPDSEEGWWYRATFTGTDPFWDAETLPVQEVEPEKTSDLTWSGTAGMVWRRTAAITGTLTSAEDNGLGIEERRIGLYGRVVGESTWALLAESGPVDYAGNWSMEWLWPQELLSAIDLRAMFLGDPEYDFSSTAVEQIGPAAVAVDVSWSLPDDPVLDATYPTTVVVGVPVWDGAIPDDPPEVLIERREPSGSANAWTVHSRLPLPVGGTVAFDYTIDTPHADHRARYPASSGFAEGKSEEMSRIISLLTTVSTPSVPPAQVGQQVTVQATVRDETDALASSGQANLEVFAPSGTDFEVYGSVQVANGAVAVPWTPVEPGEHRLRISFDGTAGLLPSVSPEAVSNPVVGVPLLTQGSVTNTSAAFSWAAVSGADSYEVQKGTTTQHTGPELSYTAGSLANYTDYSFRVRALAGGIPGAWSATITCKTGRPELRNTGSFSRQQQPTSTGTYRPSEGNWSVNGNYLVHGFYSVSSRSGHGVANYDGAGFRSWVTGTYGSTVLNNLSWDSFKLRISREGAAGHDGKTIVLYVTSARPHVDGQPPFAGGLLLNRPEIVPTGVWDRNETVEVTIPKAWAHWSRHVLMNETNVANISPNPVRGFLIRQDSSTNYAKYYGTNLANSFRLTVNCSWNYVTQTAVAGKWY